VTISELTERELVARIQRRLPPPPPWMPVGIGDDAAVVEPARNRLEVLTVDAVVEGVHFDRRFTPPAAIGHRALAVNLSDLAAMGAAPRLALLSFALPPSLACDDFDAMVGGLAALAARCGLHVAGGNLTRTPGPLTIDVTVVGAVKRRQVLTRAGARPGDEMYVSGSVGAAAAGLESLQHQAAGRPPARGASLDASVERYLYPEPRLKLGLLLGRNRAASACIDLSDGLADGVRRIAEASKIGVEIDEAALPVDPGAAEIFGARRGAEATSAALDRAIAASDDYELLFTVHPRRRGRLRAAYRHSDVTFTRIGVCTAGRDLVVARRAGDPAARPLPAGYGHFR